MYKVVVPGITVGTIGPSRNSALALHNDNSLGSRSVPMLLIDNTADHKPSGVPLRRPETADRRSEMVQEGRPGHCSHMEDADDRRDAL